MSKGRKNNLFDDFFKQVANLTPSLIAVYNVQNGNYVFINSSLKKILGYDPAEWKSGGFQFITSLIHPDDLSHIIAKNNQALKKENLSKKPAGRSPIVSFEYRMKHRNGSYRWLHTDGTVFSKDKNGVVEHVINISIDITDRKILEEQLKSLTKKLENRVEERTRQLKENESRYRSFMNQSSEGIWRIELEKPLPVKYTVNQQIDHFYKFAYMAECNISMAKMYGFKKTGYLIGARLGDLLVREDPDNIEYLTAFISSDYKLSNAQSHEKDKKGEDKYFLNSLTGTVENGLLIRAWGTQIDITDRMQIQEKISESESRLQSIIDGSSQVISLKNLKGEYLLVNSRFEKDYKITKEEIKSKTDFDIFPVKFAHIARTNDLEVIKSGRLLEKEEILPKDGQLMTYLAVKFPLKDKKEKIYAVCNISTDITERKLLEKQKDEFLSIASHELKTPLTTIRTYAQLLQSKLKNHQNLGYLSKMVAESNRLSELVNELMDVSRVNSGKLVLQKEQVQLNALIQNVIEDMQNISESHKIIFKTKLKIKASVDKHRINQVLINLISNAVKFSPDAKKILTAAKINGEFVIVSVKDSGVGISKTNLEHIFEPFFQEEGTSGRSYQGLGLGLHISREIILSHGGKIWVKSHEGKGSTFYFSIPLKPLRKI